MKQLLYCFAVILSISSAYANTDTDFWRSHQSDSKQVISHQGLQVFLDNYLISDDTGVNLVKYGRVSAKQKQGLEHYLRQLQQQDPRSLNQLEQKAYWVNLYNALTLQLIIDNYPVTSIKKLGDSLFSFGPWDDELATIAGKKLSLNDIEHKILRPIWQDPRIHYAVNCASYSCPNLASKVYTASNLEPLLEQQARDYINHSRGVSFNQEELQLSSIYHWYKEDFGTFDQLLAHLNNYAEPGLAKQLSKVTKGYDHDYDWSLNSSK